MNILTQKTKNKRTKGLKYFLNTKKKNMCDAENENAWKASKLYRYF